MAYKTFIFKSYEVDGTTIRLNYSYDDELNFTETLTWNRQFTNTANLEPALQLSHLVLGISYFKAYLAPEITLPDYAITDEQAQFLNELYTNGLGEFLYVNKLDFADIAQFKGATGASTSPANNDQAGILLPVSGGKDSLLTAEILRSGGHNFTPLHVTTTGAYPAVLDQFGEPIIVKRSIAAELIEANSKGAYNGHVPFSAIIDAILLVTAAGFGYKDVVLSHESSANEATTIYRGREVNHQFSKTTQFDENLQNYVRDYINPNIRIFSMLSGLGELKINELFVQKGLFAKYAGLWSSCNRANYKLGHNNSQLSWCGECSKCANAFLLLAPFVDRNELSQMFAGKNLLASEDLQPTFASLLGEGDAKPFECVAEINELRQAVKLLQGSGNWPEADQYPSQPVPDHPITSVTAHIPAEYQTALSQFIAQK